MGGVLLCPCCQQQMGFGHNLIQILPALVKWTSFADKHWWHGCRRSSPWLKAMAGTRPYTRMNRTASKRAKESRAWGRERIITRRASSTVKPICFDQARLIQLMTPKPNNLVSYCVTPCKPHPVNMYWMRRLLWGSYKILSCSFSMLLPDVDVTQQMVVWAVHMGGSIRAVTRCLHQRKLAKLRVLLFSKTDCATGAQLWEKGFLAKLSTSSESNSTTHFFEQFEFTKMWC